MFQHRKNATKNLKTISIVFAGAFVYRRGGRHVLEDYQPLVAQWTLETYVEKVLGWLTLSLSTGGLAIEIIVAMLSLLMTNTLRRFLKDINAT